jgi:hypothetical protein
MFSIFWEMLQPDTTTGSPRFSAHQISATEAKCPERVQINRCQR